MVGVTIFIIFFLFSINSNDEFIEAKPLTYNDDVKPKHQKQDWLMYFSKTKKSGYFYPVNEIYVKINLNEKITKTITYRLSTSRLDSYQLFCLKVELKNRELKYLLDKSKNGVELFIFSQDRKRLDSLIKALKNYNIIVVSIKPYKEEK